MVIELIVASAHYYFAHIHNIKEVAEVVLAAVPWPLVLLGVDASSPESPTQNVRACARTRPSAFAGWRIGGARPFS